MRFCTCRCISFVSSGLTRYGALFGSGAPGTRSMRCSIPRSGGRPGGSSSGKTSENSCNNLDNTKGGGGEVLVGLASPFDTVYPMDITMSRVCLGSDTCDLYFSYIKVNHLLYTCSLDPFEDGILLDTPLVCMHRYCRSFTDDDEECKRRGTPTPSAREAWKRRRKKTERLKLQPPDIRRQPGHPAPARTSGASAEAGHPASPRKSGKGNR